MIIGHEITHGVGDQGRHIRANGNMNNWWGEVTASNFAERTKCMENQYSQLEFAGMQLNGKLTLGENIADNGVITLRRGSRTVKSTAEFKWDEGYSVWPNPENPNSEHARTIKCGGPYRWFIVLLVMVMKQVISMKVKL